MRMLLCALAVIGMVALSGCVMALGPVTGAITIDQRGPVAMGSASAGTKVGTAKAQGIVLVSFGDASIEAAMKAAGITKVHHVDCETLNVLGIYARYETLVYGE
jgi:hypothetical protein